MRYFLELSFAGEAYHGWQIQPNATTVQELINTALSTLLRAEIEVTGAGRTDTGVHALQMYCHFDTEGTVQDYGKFIYNLNSLLPKDIAIKSIEEVRTGAHVRFDATQRTYVYKIVTNKEPFFINRALYYPHYLDVQLMNKACENLKKHNSFSSFSKSGTQVKTDKCVVSHAEWKQKGSELEFVISADRFLRNMVRAIVGTMLEIGSGNMDLTTFDEVIKSGDRAKAGTSVPAHGLYLTRITYPDSIFAK